MPEFKIEIEPIRFESFRGDFGSINDLNMDAMGKKLNLTLEKDGKGRYVKGEKENLYIDDEFLKLNPDDFMTKLTETLGEEKAKDVNDHLQKNKSAFPTDDERKASIAKSNEGTTPADVTTRGGLDTEKPTDEDGIAKQTWFNGQIALNITAFVLLAGLTVAGLYLINKQNNGCWLINTGTGEKLQRVATSTDTTSCNLCYSDNSSPQFGIAVCNNYCTGQQFGNCLASPPIPVNPDQTCCLTTSCHCMESYDTTKNPHVFIDTKLNYGFKVVNESIFDTFAGVLAGMGAIITGIVNDVMDIAKDIVGLMNIMWIILIAVGGIAVLGLIIWGITEGVKAGKKNKPPDKSLEPISGGYALTRGARRALCRLSKF